MVCCFFSSRRRHTRYWRDWSSDVCSSDLKLDARDYSITIGGRVRKPMKVSLADLKKRRNVQQPTILECAGTGRSYAHPPRQSAVWGKSVDLRGRRTI